MTFREAEQFLSATPIDNSQPTHWADLGCGACLFTKVLSGRLHSGSCIYAVDKRLPSGFQTVNNDVTITPVQADFVEDDLVLHELSGILMANSLHYVKDKTALLQKLKTYLLPGAVLSLLNTIPQERINGFLILFRLRSCSTFLPAMAFSILKKPASEGHCINREGCTCVW